ncbi:MAG: DUF3429 domain-containing protein [Erythrobacter sp.]|jgi:hypothetical protein|nr:DUF3429 domain-containing protein [Erythrobacter sp.]
MDQQGSLTAASRLLGYSGLLPQVICVALVATDSEYRFTALFMGFVYATMIFSFLGGVWWGQAISGGRQARAQVYVLAVLPSLIGAALFFPLNIGWEWPGPALLYLGAFIALSPMIDRALGYARPDFMRLRWQLSLGLGGLTILLGVLGTTAMAPSLPTNPHASPAAATEMV